MPSSYRLLFRLVFARLDAEVAHRVGFTLIRLVGYLPGLSRLLAARYAPQDPVLRVHALGLDFPGPLGLAAGFDKDAEAPDQLAALGFGFVEVGTVTARPQPGNPRPRLFRLVEDRALINRMGFNNHGSAAAAQRLAARRGDGDGVVGDRDGRKVGRRAVVGANIGKSKVIEEADAVEDYAISTRRLAGVADYLVVNVSSPNTPGLRALQAVGALRPLLTAVRAELDAAEADAAGPPRHVPLLVKIAPDLDDDDLDAVADLAVELGLDGIIATNTTISRAGLRAPADAVEELGAGGLSGPPLADRSLQVLRRLRDRVGDRLVLVAAGGVEDAEDAWDRIAAGATLVQGYTAFIYGGPFWAARLHRDLAARTRREGYRSIQEAVGTRP